MPITLFNATPRRARDLHRHLDSEGAVSLLLGKVENGPAVPSRPERESFEAFLREDARVPVGGGHYGPYSFEGREVILDIVRLIDRILAEKLTDSYLAIAGGAQWGKTILELNFLAYATAQRFLNVGLYLPDADLVQGIVDTKLRPDVIDQIGWFAQMISLGKAVNQSGKAVDRKGAFNVTDGRRRANGMVLGLGKVPTSFTFDIALKDERDDLPEKNAKFVEGRLTNSALRFELEIGTQRMHGRGQHAAWKSGSQGVVEIGGINPEEAFPGIIRCAVTGTPLPTDPKLTWAGDFRHPLLRAFPERAHDANLQLPRSEVDNIDCAGIITTFLRWVPDAVAWFDYSTSPPTFNVTRRGEWGAVTLAAYGGSCTGFDLTRRDDLAVQGVVCKYAQTESVDGATFNELIVRKYPANAPDPAFDILVTQMDLQGGSKSYQKQTLKVTDRPTDYNAANGTGSLKVATLGWLRNEHRADWLKSYTIPAGSDPGFIGGVSPGNTTVNDITVNVDETKLVVTSVVTTLVDNHGGNLVLPTGTVAPGTGPGTHTGDPTRNALDYLGVELLEGKVQPWMENVYVARVRIEVTLQYTGDDPVVQALFGSRVSPCSTKITSTVTVTNGEGQQYSTPTNETPAEPVPDGIEQLLYEAMSQIHYTGQVQLVEPECTWQVGLNNVLNLSGGRSEWITMVAQVASITQDIGAGQTTLKLGPPRVMSAQQWLEMQRAARGRRPSSQKQQRQSGKPADDNATIDSGPSPSIGIHLPPTMTKIDPWSLQVRKSSSGWQCRVYEKSSIENVTTSNLNTWFTLNHTVSGGDAIWIEGTVSDYTCTDATIRSLGQGNTDFDPTGGTPDWDSGGKGAVVDDGATPPDTPKQTKFRLLTHTILADSNGNPVVLQITSTNLKIFNTLRDTRAALYPRPV